VGRVRKQKACAYSDCPSRRGCGAAAQLPGRGAQPRFWRWTTQALGLKSLFRNAVTQVPCAQCVAGQRHVTMYVPVRRCVRVPCGSSPVGTPSPETSCAAASAPTPPPAQPRRPRGRNLVAGERCAARRPWRRRTCPRRANAEGDHTNRLASVTRDARTSMESPWELTHHARGEHSRRRSCEPA